MQYYYIRGVASGKGSRGGWYSIGDRKRYARERLNLTDAWYKSSSSTCISGTRSTKWSCASSREQ